MQRDTRVMVTAGLAMLLASCKDAAPVVAPEAPEPEFQSMDNLNTALAQRAATRLGFEVDEYRVIVTEAGFAPGTLLTPNTSRVESYTACAPGEPRPPEVALPSMFPDYSISNTVAASFGLDEAVLSSLAAAKVEVTGNRAAKLTFRNVKASFLANDQLLQVLKQPACKQAIGAGEYFLVRGEIKGQRSLALDGSLKANAEVKAATIGNVAITPLDGRAAVAINDENPVPFLLIIAVVRLPEDMDRGGPRGPAPGAMVVAPDLATVETDAAPGRGPASVAPTGLVYVQRDRDDRSAAASAVVAALSAGGLRVADAVENVPHDRMPVEAQVRYFNEADRSAGEAALKLLQARFPAAKLRRVGLKAPAGQLEVWLPRAG